MTLNREQLDVESNQRLIEQQLILKKQQVRSDYLKRNSKFKIIKNRIFAHKILFFIFIASLLYSVLYGWVFANASEISWIKNANELGDLVLNLTLSVVGGTIFLFISTIISNVENEIKKSEEANKALAYLFQLLSKYYNCFDDNVKIFNPYGDMELINIPDGLICNDHNYIRAFYGHLELSMPPKFSRYIHRDRRPLTPEEVYEDAYNELIRHQSFNQARNLDISFERKLDMLYAWVVNAKRSPPLMRIPTHCYEYEIIGRCRLSLLYTRVFELLDEYESLYGKFFQQITYLQLERKD